MLDNLDPTLGLVIVAIVALIALLLSVAALLQARKARSLNFERDEKFTKLSEKVSGQEMQYPQLELKLAQLQQRLDLEYLNKLQTTVESDPRHYPGQDQHRNPPGI